ncbi:MAG TPA: energy transducer TonB [Candidatus Angelobacter sp.]|nr:energy transducer TonB [Candidatus Angelobacter sp.]
MEAQRDTAEEKDKQITSVPELHLHLLDADLAEDVVSNYRRREAAWISLATHGVIIALLLLIPKWMGTRAVLIPLKEKQETMIYMPDDLSHPKTPPKTDIVSDKNRLASTKTPSKEELRKLLDARRAGTPKPPTPPPGQQMAQQQSPAPEQAPAPPPPPQQTTQQAQLEAPKPSQPNKSPFTVTSPGSAVNQAIQSVANGHSSGIDYGTSGDYGSALHPKTERNEGMEILSDTLGVDFGPYMKRLHYTVQNHWDPLIPESALPPVMKKGVVVIQFSIGKDGRVTGMKLISSSGDTALDRAAWGAITDAIPLPKLPVQFAGQYLELRARFYYNPDKADMR